MLCKNSYLEFVNKYYCQKRVSKLSRISNLNPNIENLYIKIKLLSTWNKMMIILNVALSMNHLKLACYSLPNSW